MLYKTTRSLCQFGAVVVVLVVCGGSKVRGDAIRLIVASYPNVSTQADSAMSPGTSGASTFYLRPFGSPLLPPAGVTEVGPIGVQLLSYNSLTQAYTVSLFDPSMPSKHQVTVTTSGANETEFLFSGVEEAFNAPNHSDIIIVSGLTVPFSPEALFQDTFVKGGGVFVADLTGATLTPPVGFAAPTASFSSTSQATVILVALVPEPASLALWTAMVALGSSVALRGRWRTSLRR